MSTVTIPNDWYPLPHQQGVWAAMDGGIKRAALCWHRRAGKDSFALNYLAMRAMQEPGVYWHMLPTATQARKVIWNGVDRHGRRIIDQAVPPAIHVKSHDQEMFIELINGSIIQLVGSDNFDSLVGANPIGVVFSEYAIANPAAWNYIRPMLLENKGWAIFISTPRGHNHFYDMYTINEDSPRWYCEQLDVTQTTREDGTPIITQEDLQNERDEGMSESFLQQEYYVSWEGGLEGAFYTEEIKDLRENRLYHIPNDPTKLSMTAWDIGFRDKTAIGVFQIDNNGYPVMMDWYTDRNKGLPHYIRHVHNWPYTFNYHFGPHDLEQTEYTTEMTITETASRMGLEFEVLPRSSIEDGIDATRAFLRVLRVNDTPNNREFLALIGGYRRQYDDKRAIFLDKPFHDFTSDAADMLRYAAISWHKDNFLPWDETPTTAIRAFGRR